MVLFEFIGVMTVALVVCGYLYGVVMVWALTCLGHGQSMGLLRKIVVAFGWPFLIAWEWLYFRRRK